LNVFSYLVEHGADLFVTDSFGSTPLSEAKKYDFKNVVDFISSRTSPGMIDAMLQGESPAVRRDNTAQSDIKEGHIGIQ